MNLKTVFGMVLIMLPLVAWAAPPTMQAIVQGEAGLSLQTVDTPRPKAGEVLIRVYAAGVNPVDWKRRWSVPGHDAAGVVDSVGEGVTAFKIGDAVVARAPGAYAQYAIAPTADMALKPRSFTFEQAGGIPIASVAAYRAVMDSKISRGQRVAVIGAAGGSGSAAVQIAHSLGAVVIASAHSSQIEYLQALGVKEIVAYDKEDVAARIKNVDVVLNMVDGQAAPSLAFVKRGGRFASISGSPGPGRCEAAGVSCVVIAPGYVGISDGEALRALVALADRYAFQVAITQRFPLSEAVAAMALNRAGDTLGKIVLIVDPKASLR